MAIQLNFKSVGEGRPLVILHGVFGSGENWFTVSKLFSPHFQIFMVDARNHGRSPHSDDFTFDLMVSDLLDFANQQGFEKFDLIGHSMGGKVAMKFASIYPEKLNHLVVVDIAPRYYKPHHQDVIAGLKAIDLEKTTSRIEAEIAMSRFVTQQDTRQFLLKNLYRTEEGKFAWRINLPVLEKALENIGEPLDHTIKIKTPTLFLKGENSKYISQLDEEQIRGQFADSHVVTIKNAGHWVHAEQPVAFAETVIPYLQS